MRLRRVAAFMLLGVVLAGVAGAVWFSLLAPAQGAPNTAQTGSPAPQIALPIVGGGTSDLTAHRGKVVLLNFWATWCEPCKAEMPALQQLADELRDRPFILYSIDLQEDAPQVEAFQRQYGLRLNALLDENGDVVRAYGVRALPSTFVIDKQGVLRLKRIGQLPAGGPETQWSDAWLADQVRRLLAAS
jgi:cytochrome c biogenesis protein CcmG/thiol:disulfide interchange protein DsbE